MIGGLSLWIHSDAVSRRCVFIVIGRFVIAFTMKGAFLPFIRMQEDFFWVFSSFFFGTMGDGLSPWVRFAAVLWRCVFIIIDRFVLAFTMKGALFAVYPNAGKGLF